METLSTVLKEIGAKIYLIRNLKVMLDVDLAPLYGAETKNLNKAVKRNSDRFPEDFMFQLTEEEYDTLLRFQIGTSKTGRGGRRTRPFAFTQEGIAMLSGVLHSDRAVQANIHIMRAFVQMRNFLASNNELRSKLVELEAKSNRHDKDLKVIFDAIRNLMSIQAIPHKRITGLGRKDA